MLHAFVPNQGSGWHTRSISWPRLEAERTRHDAARALATDAPLPPTPRSNRPPTIRCICHWRARWGIAPQLHLALADRPAIPHSIRSPPARPMCDVDRALNADIDITWAALDGAIPQLDDATASSARALLGTPEALKHGWRRPPPADAALKIRHHGDYHLGQVLMSEHDFIIVDFEGEPSRPVAERRSSIRRCETWPE